jgi:RNA polymerase sigma factor for flagellar operon FliA
MATKTRIAARRQSRTTLRDGLITAHLPLVHHVANRMYRATGRSVDLDDLVSAGTVGLIEAAHGFDPDRGLAFATFAVPRIRGAMLDDLRSVDTASRSVRSRQKAIQAATEALASRLGRHPRHDEVADELEVDADTLWAWKGDVDRTVPVPIDAPVDGATGPDHSSALADPEVVPIDEALGRRQEVEQVKDAILELADRHRVVLSLYFFEELTLKQIGQVIGVTESRVSQLRTEALKILRERLAPAA